jgi:hypothetical protein
LIYCVRLRRWDPEPVVIGSRPLVGVLASQIERAGKISARRDAEAALGRDAEDCRQIHGGSIRQVARGVVPFHLDVGLVKACHR